MKFAIGRSFPNKSRTYGPNTIPATNSPTTEGNLRRREIGGIAKITARATANRASGDSVETCVRNSCNQCDVLARRTTAIIELPLETEDLFLVVLHADDMD